MTPSASEIISELRHRLDHFQRCLEMDISEKDNAFYRCGIAEFRDMLEWILDDNRDMDPAYRQGRWIWGDK